MFSLACTALGAHWVCGNLRTGSVTIALSGAGRWRESRVMSTGLDLIWCWARGLTWQHSSVGYIPIFQIDNKCMHSTCFRAEYQDCGWECFTQHLVWKSALKTKQDLVGPSWWQTPPSCVPHLSLVENVSLLALAQFPNSTFNQRSGRRSKCNSQAGQSNDSLAIKQSQGPLVPPQGV